MFHLRSFVVVVLLAWSPLLRGAENPRPNIILCMSDDQGWGDVGYYGHPRLQTPVLDEMAASGLRLDRFYAAAPVCSPTRGSVLTGRHPNRFGCFSWGHTLRPQEITLAKVLSQAGYATGHFGKWHLGDVRNDCPVNPGRSGFQEWTSSPNFFENDPLLAHNGRVIQTQGESSTVIVEAALAFVRHAVQQQQPFLAVVWFGSPHLPHQASEELKALYKDFSPAEQNYLGEITGIDRALGRLRNELQNLGVRENTLLWYTSDNGGQGKVASNGGLRGAKGDLWEGGIRVPAIIEWPAIIRSPRIENVPAVTSDIFPTVLDLVKVAPPDQRPIDGVSLAGLILKASPPATRGIGFWVYPEAGIRTPSHEWLLQLQQEQAGTVPPTAAAALTPTALLQKHYPDSEYPGHAAWIEGDFKLHRIPVQKGARFQLELYNLKEDPREANDLAAREPERVKLLEQHLLSWEKSVVRSLNGDDY